MKKLLFGIFALFLATGLMAQNDKTSSSDLAELRAERITKYLVGKLELNDKQEKAVYDLQLNVQKEYLQLAETQKKDPEAFRRSQLRLAKDTDFKILAELNANQKAIYQEILDRRRPQTAPSNRR